MNISVKWCLENLQKAYKLHFFEGNINQFKKVLELAHERGIEYTKNVTDELINEIMKP